MVEGGVGILWRADGHNGEVKVVDGVGGDRGGDGILLPLLVGLANQDSCSDKPEADDKEPQNLCQLCLKRNIMHTGKGFTKTYPCCRYIGKAMYGG